MVDRYLTVAGDGFAETEEKRSRFLAYASHVASEAEARAAVERLRKQRWDAQHHCTAFVLGPRGEVARSNDDGEPAGTAGAPMLEVIRGAGLSDVLVVVVRYFGGTLLGAGGLVRAYSSAARLGLADAGIRERRLLTLWVLSASLAEAGKVENDLRSRGVQIEHVDYVERATFHLATDLDLADVGGRSTGTRWS